ELSAGQMVQILADNLSHDALLSLVNDEIISEQILATWSLTTSLFNKAEIDQAVAEKYPHAAVYFRSWLNSDFLSSMLSTRVVDAGVRSAVLGTLWVMVLTIIFAFPLGVAAAIYLEEYASGSLLHRIIETNIRNLAGVPSIIYGLLGLAIFV